MAWIKIDQTLPTHRKVLALADDLRVSPAHIVGCLVTFWTWAVDNAPGGRLDGVSAKSLARAAGWSGNAERWVVALQRVALLDDHSGALSVHEWETYGGKLERRRQLDTTRKQRVRADSVRTEGGCPQDVRVPRVEQSRVEQKKDPSALRAADAADFDARFWQPYPAARRHAKAECLALWRALSESDRDACAAGLSRWRTSEQWRDATKIVWPERFLKRRDWESDPPQARRAAASCDDPRFAALLAANPELSQ